MILCLKTSRNKLLSRDSSFESEEENPIYKLEKEEANEFYNMVRNIFNSANISLNNEQLYSPLLEALIKNYSKRLTNTKKGELSPNNRVKRAQSRISIPSDSPMFK